MGHAGLSGRRITVRPVTRRIHRNNRNDGATVNMSDAIIALNRALKNIRTDNKALVELHLDFDTYEMVVSDFKRQFTWIGPDTINDKFMFAGITVVRGPKI